jgi:hypothetical protein
VPGGVGSINGMFTLRAPPAGRHPLPAAMAMSPARRDSPPERLAARQCAALPQGCPGGTAAGRVTWEGWRGVIANGTARARAANVVSLGAWIRHQIGGLLPFRVTLI